MASKLRQTVVDPLSDNNPITVQVLGVCSALAITTQIRTALVMSMALTFVVVFSNLTISLMRKSIPTRIRMIVEVSVIATLVIIADQFLRAYLFDISRQLSVFVGLIITNCIVMGRAEAFALQNPPGPSMMDGLGNGLGYGIILMLVATGREIAGSGSWGGWTILPSSYEPNLLALAPPGAFILLGLIIWAQRTITRKFEEA